MTVTTNERGQQNIFAKEPQMYTQEVTVTHNERAEKLNGRLAMLGVMAAIGAYATTGQLIPGIFWIPSVLGPRWLWLVSWSGLLPCLTMTMMVLVAAWCNLYLRKANVSIQRRDPQFHPSLRARVDYDPSSTDCCCRCYSFPWTTSRAEVDYFLQQNML